jgi:uncharacterized protein YecT (DUF1311 family)
MPEKRRLKPMAFSPLNRCLLAAVILIAISGKAAAVCDINLPPEERTACVTKELRQADEALNRTYQSVLATQDSTHRDLFRDEQRFWLVLRDRECDVALRQSKDKQWAEKLGKYDLKAICVTQMSRLREAELRIFGGTPLSRSLAPRAQMRGTYRLSSIESRDTGKWYFEVTVEAAQLSLVIDALVFIGVTSDTGNVGTMVSVRPEGRAMGITLLPNDKRIGIAIDLDRGKLYVRQNGAWTVGSPGSEDGLPLNFGHRIQVTVDSSVPIRGLVDKGLIYINYGMDSFVDPIPDGYSPYRTVMPKSEPWIEAPNAVIYQ